MAIKVSYEFVKNSGKSPGEILEILNNEFISKFRSLNLYYTCILADLDLKKGILRYSSAGHPEQILLQGGEPLKLSKTGRMIGLSPASIYRDKILKVVAGDKLFLFSDGLFEEQDEERRFFGEERLYALFRNGAKQNVRHTADLVLKELRDFLNGNPFQDDLTLMGVEIPE